MKSKFSTYDLICIVTELQKLVGMRLNQIYDIDNKTYLFKFNKPNEKAVLLIESGSRIHTTSFEWPKNVAPSGFSMKMRKHLRNKRLESIKQLGIDRVVDLQFGTGEAEYHVILELYDKGNILLTDGSLTILYVLRPHIEGEEIRFAVKEKYPVDRARQPQGAISLEQLTDILNEAKLGETIKKILIPKLEYGPAIIEHMIISAGLPSNCKLGKTFDIARDVDALYKSLLDAENLMIYAEREVSKGYIVQKLEKKSQGVDGEEEVFYSNQEFHPMIFRQHANLPVKEFESFDVAVDEFFSTMESQKIDLRAIQQERDALKKLENVRKDHVVRIEALGRAQEEGRKKAEMIEKNLPLVENAILAIRAALATQASWEQVQELVDDAAAKGDSVAASIHALKLQVNNITMKLSDPYEDDDSSNEDADDEPSKPMLVDIDLDLSAYANARAYYDQKRHAAQKQQKTLDSEKKALKSAEKKTKQALKEVKAITTINKARKVFWFERFFWFISSENYLVIGGRDQQQNEIVVKRHLKANDIYVHADLQGASSIVIKNPRGGPIPPKTLNEAGVMAVSYSIAWEAKVVTSAWWVHSDQVSKTAPTGEYLTTGSFMIRGKKNYLPPCHLIMGFSFLFKLEESSVFRHADERKVRSLEDDEESISRLTITESVEGSISGTDGANQSIASVEEDQEIELEDSEDEEVEKKLNDQKGTILKDVVADVNKHDVSDDESEDDSLPKFPDTQIKLEHQHGQLSVVAESASILKNPKSTEDDSVIYLGDNKPVKIKATDISKKKQQKKDMDKNKGQGKGQKQKEDKKKGVEVESDNEIETRNEQQVKRGQRGKLKKIKEKYKDQDEEERKLRMEILQSAGSAKESKSKKGKQDQGNNKKKNIKKNDKKIGLTPFSGTGYLLGDDQDIPEIKTVVNEEEVAEEEDDEGPTGGETDVLFTLTGQPVPEDELLFAIPTVAPYNALANYKFKVKLTPGTGKRGKAAKTALNMFMREKTTTPRERDLLRSVKDQDIARNIPGKVKVSAPMLQKLKK